MTARNRSALAAILLLAALLRLWHLDFGLPALNDPDEPVFVMTALDMLREGRLNPGWFGHPATLLFYLLALVTLAVGGMGAMLGAWSGADGFVTAVFADPGLLVLPMRAAMAVLGVASVTMTFAIGRRVAGTRTGLVAAALLACNPLHVELSQLVRTDMLATLLMGWSLLHALSIAEHGRTRDHVLAGIAAGLACATKWPAVLVLVAPLAAVLWRARGDRRALRLLPVAPLVSVATLLLASPYLLLDYPTVLRDLSGEARPNHPGATGFGLIGNLAWYVRVPLLESFGPALLLAAIGTVRLWRNRAAAIVLLPTAALLLGALAAQSLVWTRWMVPLLPIVAILAALGLDAIRDRLGRGVAIAALLVAAGWSAGATLLHGAARADDPRQAATRWVLAHIPPGRTILVEHAAFDLLRHRDLLFPLARAGCIDVRTLLKGAPTHRRINATRSGRAVVDLGNVDPALLPSCRADVLILSNFARYRQEAARFPAQVAAYRRVTQGYRRAVVLTAPAIGGSTRSQTVEIFVRR
jgi:4-amino-4-deoxy-L-arabinose transferase-like glycosyltransferase